MDTLVIVGLDIGGANIKAADRNGSARSVPFAIWREPQRLAEKLGTLLSTWPDISELRLTMTAELADCFATKAEGVREILAATVLVAENRPLWVYSQKMGLCSVRHARQFPSEVAAANWHALGSWLVQTIVSDGGLLIDMGSTTTDIIPLGPDGVRATGKSDLTRLMAGELVYTGCRRTPVAAIRQEVWLRGQLVPISSEYFASSLDAWLLTGLTYERPHDCETADGRPATVAAAHSRLARVVCCDETEVTEAELTDMASQFVRSQAGQILAACQQVMTRLAEMPGTVVVAGEGAELPRSLIETRADIFGTPRVVLLSEILSPETSAAACAYALTQLPAHG